jgi:agmatine deiminase
LIFHFYHVQRKGSYCVEGGAIDSNGRGTSTLEECVDDPDIQVRNPNFTKADYEAVLYEYLGITNDYG